MKESIKKFLPYIVIFILVMLIRSFIITPIIVDGASMEPTLNDGEMMLLYKFTDVNRYDIVVINNEQGHIVKRVVGLPNEVVEIVDNVIFINGKKIDDEFNDNTGSYEEFKLGSNEYFVLGDNRLVSADSRSFGTITSDEIVGTTNFVIFPFSKFGKVE